MAFASRTRECLDWRAVFENDDSRDTEDVKYLGNLRVIVDIDRSGLEVHGVLFPKRLELRLHELTWGAPRCPEINDDVLVSI